VATVKVPNARTPVVYVRITRRFGVNSSVTSVGAAASDRFVRPGIYGSLRDERLPPAIQAATPWSLPCGVNGLLHTARVDAMSPAGA
jgi:hypothetical protein